MEDHKQMARRAEQIARTAHAGQFDKAGAPYFNHAQRVADRFHIDHDPIARAVAFLHDVVEDCPGWTLARLRAEGFCDHVVDAVDLLTKRPEDKGVLYPADYVNRLRAHPLAYNVKIADLLDNLDLSRIPLAQITAKDQRRMRQYTRILGKLIGQLHADYGEQIEAIAKGRVLGVLKNLDTGEERPIDLAPETKGALH